MCQEKVKINPAGAVLIFALLLKGWVAHSQEEISDHPVLLTKTGHSIKARSVAYSPDSKMLASGGLDGAVILWDANTGEEKMRLEGHMGGVASVCFSPDGKMLASGFRDGTIVVWDVSKQKEKARLEGHTGAVMSICFSPDGRMLASGAYDGRVKVWDVNEGKELATLLSLDGGREWLITTPEGYYNGSKNVAKFIAWRLGDKTYPAKRFEKRYQRPDLVATALRGEPIP